MEKSQQTHLKTIADRLFELREDVALRAASAVQELPGYDALEVSDLTPSLQAQIDWIAPVLLIEQRAPNQGELDLYRSAVAVRAREGVPLQSLLRALQTGFRVLWQVLLEIADAAGGAADELLSITETMHELHSSMAAQVVLGHRDAEAESVRWDEQRRANVIRDVLLGRASRPELSELAATLGLEVDDFFVPIRSHARSESDVDRTERAIAEAAAASRVPCVMGLVDGDLMGFVGAKGVLPVVDGPVGVGPAARLPDLEPAFRTASQVLLAATRFGMSGCIDVGTLSVRFAVASDDRVGETLATRLIDPVEGLGAFGPMLIETVQAFLANRMRIDETARMLFVHPNTVRYRLNRYEDLTGADLTNPDALVEVWWVLEHAKVRIHRINATR